MRRYRSGARISTPTATGTKRRNQYIANESALISRWALVVLSRKRGGPKSRYLLNLGDYDVNACLADEVGGLRDQWSSDPDLVRE